MENNCGVYHIRNVLNGKRYIGSSVDLKKRKYQHFNNLQKNKHHSQHLQSAYNKYGEENFIFEVLEYLEVKEHVVGFEQYYIDYFGYENLYNVCPKAGSRLGIKLTEEQCKNRTKRGKYLPRLKPISQETKRKLSFSHKGKILSEETRLKMSQAKKKMSDITKEKMSIAKRKRNMSNETRLKLGKSHSKAIVRIDPLTNEKVRFNSIVETGFGYHISEVLHGKKKTAYGFFWELAPV